MMDFELPKTALQIHIETLANATKLQIEAEKYKRLGGQIHIWFSPTQVTRTQEEI